MTDASTPLGQRYLLHELIGTGAMGQVYRATTRDTGETLAAKVLRPELSSDEDVVARFVQERRILMRISSPNVVAVRDLVVEADTLAIVADLVDGPNLRRHLDSAGTLAPAQAVSITAQVLRGLQAAHDLGVVHRDVKPENVLLDNGRVPASVRLTDFGVARLAHGQAITRMTALIGTVAYIAPELAEDSRATPAADVWSAGIVAYELLSGVTPFLAGNLVAMIQAALHREPARLAGISDELWQAISSMLAKAPEARPSAGAAAAALEAMLPRLAGMPALPRLQRPSATDAPTAMRPRGALLEGVQPAGVKGRDTPPTGSAPAAVPARMDRRRLRALLAGAVVLLVAVSVAAVALFHRAPPTVSESFPPVLLSGEVSSQRTWRLSGYQLSGEVRLRNGGPSTADVTYDEVLPESVAPLAADLQRVAPGGYQVVKPDPVLRWVFPDVAPGTVQTLSYQATSRGSGSPRARLARLVADQEQAEALYDASARISIRVLRALQVTPVSLTMSTGQAQRLDVTATLDDGSAAPPDAFRPTFGSPAPAVATVDVGGTVTAAGPGTAAIIVAVGGVSTQVQVTVVAAPKPTRSPPAHSQPPLSPTPIPSLSRPAPPSPSPSHATPSPAAPPVPTEPEDYGTGPAPATVTGNPQILFWKAPDQNLWAGVYNNGWAAAAVPLGMGPMASQPFAGVDATGHYFVFWKGTDGKLREGYFDGAKWQGPVAFSQFGVMLSQPAVAVAPNGHLYVFWKGPDGSLIEASSNGTTWTGPVNLGMGPLGSAPCVNLDANEHAYVYWRGVDHGLWEGYTDGTKWIGPLKIPAVANVDSAPDGDLLSSGAQGIYWKGTDNALWSLIWTGASWTTPVSVGMGPLNSRPLLVANSTSGLTWVYWRGTDQKIWGAAWTGTQWAGPTSVPQMGTIG